MAQRLAAQAFSSGDVGAFDQLMSAGTRANLADNPAAAEAAFRAALALQQKALGKDNPNTATVLMTLALQLSNNGRYGEADSLFAEAARLAPHSADATTTPRLLHYRGLDAVNRGRLEGALRLLQQAASGYTALLSPSVVHPSPVRASAVNAFAPAGRFGSDVVAGQDMLTNPSARSALLGLIEARRNDGLVLRELGRLGESATVLAAANQLAVGNGLARPIVEARLFRSTGVTAAAAGNASLALTDLSRSSIDFTQALPESKPLTDTYLLRAQQLVATGDTAGALPICRAAVASLVALKAGTAPDLVNPCLEVYAEAATKQVAKLVRDLRAGIELTTAGLPTFNIAAARTLYEDTLGKVAGSLDGVTALVVAPSGPLLAIPFETLLTGPTDPQDLADAPWLVRRFSLAHVPAPSNFVSLRRIAGGSRATQPWFGFGDFQPVTLLQARAAFPGANCAESATLLAKLPRLPYAQKELGAARQILGGSPADEMLGRGFTARAVLKASLMNFRILHFATHALLPAELACQSEPAIVTSAPAGASSAASALLTASQVVGMDLDADLIILSACNTGGPGGRTAGESLSGLARAFFFAGARALLVSHWAVNDQVAAYLVADTLARLRDQPGIGVAAALRNAQLAMLQGAGHGLPPEVAHPFFWAPLAVIGEGGTTRAVSAETGTRRMVAVR